MTFESGEGQSSSPEEWDEVDQHLRRLRESFQQRELKKGRRQERPFKDICKQFVKTSGLRWMEKNRDVLSAWNEVVDGPLQEETRAVSFRDGVLSVEVTNSPLLQELQSFHKSALVASLKALVSGTVIRDIRFSLAVDSGKAL